MNRCGIDSKAHLHIRVRSEPALSAQDTNLNAPEPVHEDDEALQEAERFGSAKDTGLFYEQPVQKHGLADVLSGAPVC